MKPEEKKTHVRPSWDEYFMQIAEMVGTRATCDRGRSGCVATRDKRILSTGYVGSPSGVKSCDEEGHEFHVVIHDDGSKTQHCIRTTHAEQNVIAQAARASATHAEQNVIAQAARASASLEGATLYVHMTPCYACAKMIINAGIVRVVANKDYHAGARSKEIFKEAGVLFELMNSELETYPGQAVEEGV